MAETAQQYTQRILGNVHDEPLNILTGTSLNHLLGDVPSAGLDWRPAEDRWSIAEILAHLADAEVVFAFRIRKIISEPGSSVPSYDQNQWASRMNYRQRHAQHSLSTFQALRALDLDLLRGLSEEQWESAGIHQERGRESVRQMVRLYAGHDVNHLRQIESLRQSWMGKTA
jgi:DinB superfamily